MRKVTVNQAVKQCTGYHRVRLALTPFSVILVCLDNEGLVEESFKLADRCSAHISTHERMEWADKVLAAFLKIKIRYEAQQVVKVGVRYVACDADTVPHHRFNNFNDAFNFIVNGGLTK